MLRWPTVVKLIVSILPLVAAVWPSCGQAGSGAAGVWASPFGLLVLEDAGASLIGSYYYLNGVLEGTLADSTLSFRWADASDAKGEGRFIFQPDGQSFRSTWNPAGGGDFASPWMARRIDDSPDPPGARSHWHVAMDIADNPVLAGRLNGTADLFVDGSSAVGRLTGVFVSDSEPAYLARSVGLDRYDNTCLTLAGTLADGRLTLRLENVHDGSASEAELSGDSQRYEGTWRDLPEERSTMGEPPQHGGIRLDRLDSGITDGLLTHARKRHDYFWRIAKAIDAPWASPLKGDPIMTLEALRDAGQPSQAADGLERLAVIYRQEGNTHRLAMVLSAEISALRACGRFREAIDRSREILNLPDVDDLNRMLATESLRELEFGHEQGGDVVDTSSLAEDDPIVIKDKAYAAEQRQDYDTALALLDKATAIYEDRRRQQTNPVLIRSSDVSIASAIQRTAMVESFRGRWNEAIGRLDRAIAVWRRTPGATANVAGLLGSRGYYLQHLGRMDDARAAVAEAIRLADDNQLAEAWRLYGQAASIEENAGNAVAAQAFYRTSLMRIEGLRGGLASDESKIAFFSSPFGAPADVYDSYVTFLMGQPGRAREALGVAERARARATLDLLGDAASAPPIVTADDIAATARRDGRADLVYFTAPRATFVWLVAPDGSITAGRIEMTNLDLEGRIDAALDPVLLGTASDDALHALTHLLTDPIAAALDALPAGTAVTVVPHKAIAKVPFAALGDDSGVWGGRWVLSYLPSLSIGKALPAAQPVRDGPLLAVVPPLEETLLGASGEEARRASVLFPGATVLDGAAATRANVLEALPRSRIALFSTHAREAGAAAYIGSTEVVLQLAGADVLGRTDLRPGQLTNVGLVVLNACESAGGRIYSGDEILGLARGFLVAGAQRVIITQWMVADQAASDIVVDLLRRIRSGLTPAQALKEAMDGYRRSVDASPAAWAPWILVGADD